MGSSLRRWRFVGSARGSVAARHSVACGHAPVRGSALAGHLVRALCSGRPLPGIECPLAHNAGGRSRRDCRSGAARVFKGRTEEQSGTQTCCVRMDFTLRALSPLVHGT